jgi:hypothetical protein
MAMRLAFGAGAKGHFNHCDSGFLAVQSLYDVALRELSDRLLAMIVVPRQRKPADA